MSDVSDLDAVGLTIELGYLVDTHIVEVSADLVQVRLLLDEAVVKLDDSFNGVYAALAQQRNYIGENVDKTIELHLHQAIIGLQFHDLTCQLLERASLRLDGMRNIIECSNDIEHKESVGDGLLQLSKKLHNTFTLSLRQTHMDSGDIELF